MPSAVLFRRPLFWLLPVLAFLAGRGAGAWLRPAEGVVKEARAHAAPRPPVPVSMKQGTRQKSTAAAEFDASTPVGRWALALRGSDVSALPDRWAELEALRAEGLERGQHEAARRLLVEKWMRLDWRGACAFFEGIMANGGPEAAGLDPLLLGTVMGRLHPQEAEALWSGGFGPAMTESARFRDAMLGALAVAAPGQFRALALSADAKMEVSRGFFMALDDVIDSDPARAAVAWKTWKDGEDAGVGMSIIMTGSGPHPPDDVRALARLAKAWSAEDPEAARTWIASLPGDRSKALAWNQYFIARGEADPRAAWAEMQSWSLEDQALASSAGPGLWRQGLQDSAQAKVLAALAKDDPVEAARLLEAYVRTQAASAVPETEPVSRNMEVPGPQRRFFLAPRMIGTDRVSLTEQGIQQAADALRTAIVEGFASSLPEAPADVARRLAAVDFAALAAPGKDAVTWQRETMAEWMKGRDSAQAALFLEEAKHLPQAATLRPAVESALAAVLRDDTGRGLALFQSLPPAWQGLNAPAVLEQAAPRSAQEVRDLLAAFEPQRLGQSFISSAARRDPAAVAQWLEHLGPDAMNGPVATQMTATWGMLDPQAAGTWLAAHPDGEATAGRLLMALWLPYEADEASRWVASLPASPMRDEAAQALIGHVSNADPEAAWAWTGFLQSEETRRANAAAIAAKWMERDPQAARAAIEAAGYTAEELGVNFPKTP